MINLAVIDDDSKTLKTIREVCNAFFGKSDISAKIDEFSSGSEFLKSEFKKIYDIIFLDVEMPGKSGLEVAEIVRKYDSKCCICFISKYSNYALNSFKVHAFDFIEKPITVSHVNKTLNDFITYYKKNLIIETNIIFETEHSNLRLTLGEILYFEYFDRKKELANRSTVVYTQRDQFVLKMKISSIYEKLPSDMFVMPHKSFIVNLANVMSIKGNTITMENGMQLPLSQKRAALFRLEFNEYIKKYLIG